MTNFDILSLNKAVFYVVNFSISLTTSFVYSFQYPNSLRLVRFDFPVFSGTNNNITVLADRTHVYSSFFTSATTTTFSSLIFIAHSQTISVSESPTGFNNVTRNCSFRIAEFIY